jgi:hypothetical protein
VHLTIGIAPLTYQFPTIYQHQVYLQDMIHFSIGDIAPDFELPDHKGKGIGLSEVLNKTNALLVFNIGFA